MQYKKSAYDLRSLKTNGYSFIFGVRGELFFINPVFLSDEIEAAFCAI
jgi:hypothetical protein